ncbi:hypothetical protein SAMN05444369_10711 [Capnocytophaga haemolytica]|uniref:Beta-carotene 15,15'-monooxygenase n=2 Tax=Capnocytophaga haemolytica TaxID=45243 RepID=A0AAX2H042_9FLAO|nr:hypothetical protein SAMN05444369_10711 [Capnocytophaga haemolytica]SNV15143.1 Uncharacterised protein [Capnocytophaga haemolytica]
MPLLCSAKHFTMEDKNYIQDLREIRSMMRRSSQFLSFSGLSGVLAGVYALVGAYFAHRILSTHYIHYRYVIVESPTFRALMYIALIVLVASLLTAGFFSYQKAKRRGERLVSSTSKRAVYNFALPLLTGGALSLLLINAGYYGLIAPMTLIFYGLACVNVSKYTFGDVHYLGITEIVLGLLSVYFAGYGLEFWVVGFGVCHILYGLVMYFKYERSEERNQ